jgi:hypothetical protein
MLLDYANQYFAADKKPANLTGAQWAEGKKQGQDVAKGALLQIALYPGASILKKNPKDPATCAQAEPLFVKALQQYTDSGQVTLQLANVYFCQRTTAEKLQQSLYEYARAVGLPVGFPFGLDAANQKAFDDFLKSTYIRLHGSEDGLAQIRKMVVKGPLPPKDFKIETAGEIALRRQQELAENNPQLAMWMSIKGQLAPQDRLRFHQEHSGPLMKRLHEWMAGKDRLRPWLGDTLKWLPNGHLRTQNHAGFSARRKSKLRREVVPAIIS